MYCINICCINLREAQRLRRYTFSHIHKIDRRSLSSSIYLMSRGAVVITARAFSTVIGPRTRKEKTKSWMSISVRKGMTQPPSQPAVLLCFYQTACIYIYIQRLHLLHARCSQAKHMRDSGELIHHILGSPNLAAAVKSVEPSSAAKSPRESAARGKKVGWQRASFQIQRDFVTAAAKGGGTRVVERGRKGVEKKGPGERTFVPLVVLSSFTRHARAPIVPRSADRFDCGHLSSSSVRGDTLLDTTASNTFCLSHWLWVTANESTD